MSYSKNKFGDIVRDADGATIPNDPQNSDWIAFQAWLSVGNEPTPDQPTAADIEAERARRLALGFNYTFPAGDARGTVRIGTTSPDMEGWDEVTQWSRTKLAIGQTTATLQIVTNSGAITVTPMEWQNILDAATAFRQPVWAASFALEAQIPIPADYAADAHWPAAA